MLWRPEFFAVRPELVLKAGIAAWGASGDPNATTMLAEPVLRPAARSAREGAAAARLSAAFLARGGDGRRPARRPAPRLPVEGCRELTAADMARNSRTGAVRVDPRTHEVTLDGEPVDAPPLEEVPTCQARYLLG